MHISFKSSQRALRCRVETRARAERASGQARLDRRVTACASLPRSAQGTCTASAARATFSQRSCPPSRFPAAFTQDPRRLGVLLSTPDRSVVLTSAARGVQLRRSMRVPMHGRSARKSAASTAVRAQLRAQRRQHRATGPSQAVEGRARVPCPPAAESLRKNETPCTQPQPLLPGGKRTRQTTSSRPLRHRPPRPLCRRQAQLRGAQLSPTTTCASSVSGWTLLQTTLLSSAAAIPKAAEKAGICAALDSKSCRQTTGSAVNARLSLSD